MLETQCCSSIVAIAVNAMVDRHAHWSKVEIKTVRQTSNSTGRLPAALTTPAVAKHSKLKSLSEPINLKAHN